MDPSGVLTADAKAAFCFDPGAHRAGRER